MLENYRRICGGLALLALFASWVATKAAYPAPMQNTFSIVAVIFFGAYLFLLALDRWRQANVKAEGNPLLQRQNRQTKLFALLGIALILFSFAWGEFIPAVLDMNTTFGAVIDIGGMLLFIFLGFGLIFYRWVAIWGIITRTNQRN